MSPQTRPAGSGATAAPQPDAKMASRIKAVRRRPWLWRALIGLVVLALGALVWVVAFSSVLAVKQVDYSGAPKYLQSEAKEAAGVPMGRPLIRVDTEAIRSRILATQQFSDVEVTRSWPDRITIDLAVKRPILVWKNPQGEVKLVDESGLPYRTADKYPKGVPSVDVALAAPEQEDFAGVVEVLRSCPVDRSGRVSGLRLDKDGQIRFTWEKRQVIWGDSSDSPKKWAVLLKLLERPEVKDSSAPVNVTSPDNPVLSAPGR